MISEALRLIRVFHDLKQVEAARRIGISQSYLSELERGLKPPPLDVLEKYSVAFGVPVSSIMYFSENMNGDAPKGATGFVAKKIIALLQFIEQKAGRQDELEVANPRD